ncbi:MAG: AmmeMemoRadiSam system protein B [Spirochaetes bacterium]|nr:AmmeMemoRadiSam system protein B [Spirochaetota bacterium]
MSGLTRNPVVSGLFYPAGKDNLSKMIGTLLREARTEVKDNIDIFGLISPHAGYVYSGGCAAFGFKWVKDRQFDTVIVLGPSHYAYLDGSSVWKAGMYKTSLGEVPIDTEATQYLLDHKARVEFSQAAHLQEHSIEVQIPFLQQVLKNDFKLVPLIIGNQTLDYARLLASSIVDLLQKKEKQYLLVASSDLSHYHSDEVAQRLDGNIIKAIEKMDPDTLYSLLENGKGEACGAGPIMVLLLAAKKLKKDNIKILNVTNSGQVSGDKSRVVGYMSAIIY